MHGFPGFFRTIEDPRNVPAHTIRRLGRRLLFSERLSEDVASAWFDEPPLPPQRQVRSVHVQDSEVGKVVVKRDTSSPWRRLARLGSPGALRAHRSFRLGLELEAAGLPTPRPLAIFEGHAEGQGRGVWIVLAHRKGQDLDSVLEQRKLEPDERAQLWGELGRVVGEMHVAGYRQRDLKAPNVLVQRTRSGDLKVALLDLEGMARTKKPTARATRIEDLGRLIASLRGVHAQAAGVSGTERDDLLRAYLHAFHGSVPHLAEVGEWSTLTERWALKKERRNRRRGRALA